MFSRLLTPALLGTLLLFHSPLQADTPGKPEPKTEVLLKNWRKILFLGDSITFGGHYVTYFETGLRLAYPKKSDLEILNAGLSSETVSGLSEAGHANGKFPRPDLHERLSRVLEKIRPQVVFACYGMNDGIYLTLEPARFEAFKNGMHRLHKAVENSGAKIIHLTPPTFDPGPDANPADFNYNQTLDAYSQWLLEQKHQGWNVIDLHFPMNRELQARRNSEPQFRFSKDRIHPSPEGHWIMAREILRSLALPSENFTHDPGRSELLGLVGKRSELLKLAWLTETGHVRPGVPAGLPIQEAVRAATPLTERIEALLSNPPQ